MFTLKQLKNNFTKFLFLEFKESGPQVDDSLKTQKEKTERLTPEQEKIKALQDKLEQIQATEKITKKTADILFKGLISDPSIKNDPEAKETIRLFEKYKAEFEKAKQEGKITQEELNKLLETTSQVADSFEYNVGVEYNSETGETKENELTDEKLKTISNREFLAISPENRLQYITKNHIDAESISNGIVNNLEFTFTFDGKFNKELYLKTTAGQVLPNEVREVQSAGITYSRTGLKGEFFAQGGRRLLIHEGTKIDDIKVGTQDEMKKLEIDTEEKINKFIQDNSGTEKYKDIVSETYKRNIDPKFAIELLEDNIEKMSIVSLNRKVLIENILTEYDRIKGKESISKNSNEKQIQLVILQKLGGEKWKQKAEKLGISSDTIKQFESREYSVTEFLNKAKEISVKIEEKYGIPRQVVLGQALLESGNGQSELTKLANNAFGYKAKNGENSIGMHSDEYINGTFSKKLSNFRTFDNLEDSFDAYAKLLTSSSRYQSAFNYKNNPEQFLYEIIKAGYATLPPDKYVANVKARLKRFGEKLA